MGTWITGVLFVAGAILIGFLPAQLMRRRFGGIQPADTRAVASDVMARIGVMHGLILSLVFASTHQNALEFDDGVTTEASLVTQVHFNAKRYGDQKLQAASVAYLTAAIEKDWPALRQGNELSPEGWLAWREMLDASLVLVPVDRRQQLLADRIASNIWQIENLRQARGFEAGRRMSGEFWLVSVVGLMLIALLLFVHRITGLHHAIMAMYSGFTGLTLFLIYDMSHPFSGAMTIEPTAFEMALASIRSGI